MRDVNVVETRCKSILNHGSARFTEYSLNAYLGCAFACSFCYVPNMRERHKQTNEQPWGSWIQVKINAPDVLRRQMLNVEPDASICIGTAADSWQPIEKHYEISRKILEELAYYPNHVTIITRSPLLMRDIDILRRMENVSIGVSLSSFDEQARRIFEPHAPSVSSRVRLVRALVDAGLKTTLFWCPILTGVSDDDASVKEYIRQASETGVRKLVCGTLNYASVLMPPHLKLLDQYRAVKKDAVRPSLTKARLSQEIARWAAHYHIDCKL